ncbi:hypothetical protein [Endozoicomonas montiporae]|uniref:Uncharacterized protein n=1 Tax=Endozoicomonas montiporae CL-33 TaxID=570277 RepID=A0A142BDA9_9GAMM|nr:hypothetical protein [Endozoicomonas montiporae]AMO56735.1 hypothetical protein EZMO1_2673 [Endozoicomonas montiporae CL-33]
MNGTLQAKPNHRRIGKEVNQLHGRLVKEGVLDPGVRFVYRNPESAIVNPPYLAIKRRILEGQLGGTVAGGLGAFSAGAAFDGYKLVWGNDYVRFDTLLNRLNPKPENESEDEIKRILKQASNDLNYLADEQALNLSFPTSEFPPEILNLLARRYPNDFLCSRSGQVTELCIGQLLQRLSLVARQFRERKEAASIGEQFKQNEASAIDNAIPFSWNQLEQYDSGFESQHSNVALFIQVLMKANFEEFNKVQMEYLNNEKSKYVKEVMKRRKARSIGELQRKMLVAALWLVRQYKSLNHLEGKHLPEWMNSILIAMQTNHFQLSQHQYKKHMLTKCVKKGRTVWNTGVGRAQFSLGEASVLVREIEDENHCNPDSDGTFILAAFRFTLTGHINLNENLVNVEEFYDYLGDVLGRRVVDGESININLDPGAANGVLNQFSEHYKVEIFMVKDENGNYRVQYIRHYRGEEYALRTAASLPTSKLGIVFGVATAADALRYKALKERWGNNTLTYLYGLAHGLIMGGRTEDLHKWCQETDHRVSLVQMMVGILDTRSNIHNEFIERLMLIYPGYDWKALLFDEKENAELPDGVPEAPFRWVSSFRKVASLYGKYKQSVSEHRLAEARFGKYKENLVRHYQTDEAVEGVLEYLKKDYDYYLPTTFEGYEYTERFGPEPYR